MLNSTQSNHYFAVGVVASLATSVALVMASLAGPLSRMQVLV